MVASICSSRYDPFGDQWNLIPSGGLSWVWVPLPLNTNSGLTTIVGSLEAWVKAVILSRDNMWFSFTNVSHHSMLSLLWSTLISMEWHLISINDRWINWKIINKELANCPDVFYIFKNSFSLSTCLIWNRLFGFRKLTPYSNIHPLIHLLENTSFGCCVTSSVCCDSQLS